MLRQSFWPEVCFHAEQTAQLALKAYLFLEGRRFVNVHSIRSLAEECSKYDATFTAIIDYGIVLDRYYLTTRYPDALPPPAIPSESFTEREAHQALDYATEMVELARARISREPRR
jgi:HEPN domain-containing protein